MTGPIKPTSFTQNSILKNYGKTGKSPHFEGESGGKLSCVMIQYKDIYRLIHRHRLGLNTMAFATRMKMSPTLKLSEQIMKGAESWRTAS